MKGPDWASGCHTRDRRLSTDLRHDRWLIYVLRERLMKRNGFYSEGKSKLQTKLEREKMGLIITHTGYILDYVTADKGQVLFDGKLSSVENPSEILKCVGESGYEECVR